ncbi:TolC family outer membrane protein [Novosphingobium mangrovi (ex Huang et al. 2023)]|uniref:TolC family outer membrane protein n=1 Tax=Novosphingobium mangrovi (ex Huang et al. 2023) TaxID=2976432 RepID=A0ABT2I1P9_9SPHN|nr:TolC family outer membrane protein [Novosphingobium mangrovi (ex Huang et al. 2023)]MCT2398721.1 TolC family outer membrane protein [Novosphingobium mangrovi (ex Huang et al. 2023)]
MAALASIAHADTLEQALDAAYENNPSIRGSRDLVSAADERLTRARAAYGPTLNASARHEFTTARIRGTALPSQNGGFASSAEVTLSQPLFTSGRLAAAVDAATAAKMVEREKLRASSQQLILDVVNAYVSLQRDIELYGVAVEIYRLLLQQRDVTVSRFRLRDSTEPDVDQTTNRLELAAGRVIVARSTVEASAARYRNLIGTYPGGLAPPPALPALPTLETLYAEAETHNPTLTAAKFTEAGSRAAIGAARAQMGPQASVFASAARRSLTPYQNTLREESVVAGVSLTMPLYTGGQLSAGLREAIDRNRADQQFTEQARRTMRETLATDWSLLSAASEALPRYTAAVRAAERAVEGVKKQEISGIRTLRDVLDVTNDLLNARTGAAQTRTELYLRQVAILRDAGLLSIDMFTQARPYDPDSHKAGTAYLAGLPLRPILEPADRLLLSEQGVQAPIQREDSPTYDWPGIAKNPLQPLTTPTGP